MTASLINTTRGTPFATGVDDFVYPQFIGYAERAPTIHDIYNPGTRWQDNSVNPAIIYQTTGAGLWYTDSGASGVFTSITATTGDITATEGNLVLDGADSKINIDVGTPATASAGTSAALVGGTLVVNTTSITANSLVFFTTNTLGTVTAPQAYYVSARVPGTSFTITSADVTDTSTVNYWIIN